MKKILTKIKESINKLIKKESEEDRCNRIFREFKKIVEGKSEEELEQALTGDDEFPEVFKAIRKQIRDKYPTSSQPIPNYLMTFINLLPEEPVSEDLEEASEKYACMFKSSKDEHDKIKVIFKDGANWQKEQMLKDAVDAEVTLDIDGNIKLNLKEGLLKVGDKVKLIIVKEEE